VYFAWGAFLKDISLLSSLLVVLTTTFLTATARVEEAENLHKFGAQYQAYMQQTKRFIPIIF
jgi:protein-S-isoprenylcysteine O-methyltransferase Ste14